MIVFFFFFLFNSNYNSFLSKQKKKIAAPFLKIFFLGPALTLMMVYVWARKNPHIHMNFLGVFNFRAPYLPWVLLSFTFVLNNVFPTVDLLGICIGHIYFFLEDVYPKVTGRVLLKTPPFLYFFSLFYFPSNINSIINLNFLKIIFFSESICFVVMMIQISDGVFLFNYLFLISLIQLNLFITCSSIKDLMMEIDSINKMDFKKKKEN